MAIYVIGDIQGCYTAFSKLLDKIKFDPQNDRLWLVGDLVNRGGKSLQVLRKIYRLRESVTCVLGNHDLHLLAASQQVNSRCENAEFIKILKASDSDELLTWLRARPLIHVDKEQRLVMVHAGLAPGWTVKRASRLASKVSHVLSGKEKKARAYLSSMYGNRPAVWHPGLPIEQELRAVTNTLTRMRYCKPDGVMSLTDSGPIGTQKRGYKPWFVHPRESENYTTLFGHWSALGLHFGRQAICLDSGCVWGNKLTAMRLGDQFNLIQVAGRTG